MTTAPELEIYKRVRQLYEATAGDDDPARMKIAKGKAAEIGTERLGEIGGLAAEKLFAILPDVLRQKEQSDQGQIQDLREIEFPVPAEIASSALALQLAADGLNTTLFAKFNDTPLVATPNVPYRETLDEYAQGRRLIQLGNQFDNPTSDN